MVILKIKQEENTAEKKEKGNLCNPFGPKIGVTNFGPDLHQTVTLIIFNKDFMKNHYKKISKQQTKFKIKRHARRKYTKNTVDNIDLVGSL